MAETTMTMEEVVIAGEHCCWNNIGHCHHRHHSTLEMQWRRQASSPPSSSLTRRMRVTGVAGLIHTRRLVPATGEASQQEHAARSLAATAGPSARGPLQMHFEGHMRAILKDILHRICVGPAHKSSVK